MTLDTSSDDPDPNSWAEMVSIGHDDPDAAEREAQFSARLRARAGDEAFARIQRSHALSRNPRPLTGDERAVLRETVAPLLRDLAATRRALPEIREEAHEDYGENAVCAWIQDNGGCGQGIRVWLSARRLNGSAIWPRSCRAGPGTCRPIRGGARGLTARIILARTISVR